MESLEGAWGEFPEGAWAETLGGLMGRVIGPLSFAAPRPVLSPRKKTPICKVGGPFFLSWVREVIRDEEAAVIFLQEFWNRSLAYRLDFRVVQPWREDQSA